MSEIYEPDFVERNGSWLLSVLGVCMTCISGVMVYMLKSRCRTIKCCGLECERDVLDLTTVPAQNLELRSTTSPRVSNSIVSLIRPRPTQAATSSESTAEKV